VAGDLKRFYKLEKEDISSEEESLNGIESNRIDLARGEGDIESSDEEFDSDQEAALQEEASGPWADEEIPTGDETNRLACVNLDWDHVKARDLYKVFDGFKPSNGIIKNVTIYPSEFGKEAMAKEALAGPPSEVFNQKEQDATAPLSKREKKRAATKARKEAERAVYQPALRLKLEKKQRPLQMREKILTRWHCANIKWKDCGTIMLLLNVNPLLVLKLFLHHVMELNLKVLVILSTFDIYLMV
jgi:hypothetical protein